MVLTIAGILLGCYMAVRPQETKVIPQEFMSPARITVHLNEQNEPVNVYSDEIPLSNGWQCCTQDLCRRYGIDYPLMLGLMETESSFQLDADSGWAYGVCQIGYINEEWLADKHIDIYSPLGNIEAACLILSGYLENYTTEQALMAYNCGEFGAQELWDEGIYQSDYSRSVLESAQKWRSVLNDRS
jgi:soluble lytic murein transglycosylase-like protein